MQAEGGSKGFLKRSAAVVASIAVAAFLFAWSGIYNVAASSGHWIIFDWFLRFGMSNSVSLRAQAITAPPLGDPNLVSLGAAHFQIACAFCHGSPVGPVNPVTDKMLPAPPNLATEMRPWTDEELFWIVQNGIKYTGMPGWVALERHDEIWAVVAFLKKLRGLDREAYRSLAFGHTHPPPQPGEPAAADASGGTNVALCARCHGDERGGPQSALVPSLHGQSHVFLSAALRDYASGKRHSGIMQPVAAELEEPDVNRLAAYYAKLRPVERHSASDDVLIAYGRMLATAGDSDSDVPACVSCHDRSALPSYPRLEGQSAVYMANQLRLFKNGHNAMSAGGAIMAPIAQRLDARDIDAVAAYFASISSTTSRTGAP